MKITTVILSLFFLSLAVLPCADELIGESCGTEVHFHADNEHDHEFDIDLCSPFCACQCCHTNVTTDQASYKIRDLSPFSAADFGYMERMGLDIIDPLLQPPQV